MTADYDATDEVAENNAGRDQARYRRDDVTSVRKWMSSPKGRAFVYRFLQRCHIHSTTFTPDPYVTAFNAGREDAGRYLLHLVFEACPDLYLAMLKEARAEEDRIIAQRQADFAKREEAETAALFTQGLDLPPPKGFPGHVQTPDNTPPEDRKTP